MPDEIVEQKEKELDEVSALAIRAKEDPALMAELWEAVQKLIKLWAYRYIRRGGNNRGTCRFDADDLIQSGYFALVDAVRWYDSDKCAFTTLLHFCIRKRFAEVAKVKESKRLAELEITITSLDIPIGEDGNSSIADLLADQDAEFENKVIERLAVQHTCSELLDEIVKLPEKQRDALLLTAWQGMSYQHACMALNITFKQLRSRKAAAVQKVRNSDTGKRIEAALNLGDPFRDERSRRFKTSFTGAIGLAALLSNRRQTHDANETEKPYI